MTPDVTEDLLMTFMSVLTLQETHSFQEINLVLSGQVEMLIKECSNDIGLFLVIPMCVLMMLMCFERSEVSQIHKR